MISGGIVLSNHCFKGKDSSKIALGSNLLDHSAKGQDPVRKSAYVSVFDSDAEDVGALAAHESQDCFNAASIACRWCAIVPSIVASDSSGNAEAIEIER